MRRVHNSYLSIVILSVAIPVIGCSRSAPNDSAEPGTHRAENVVVSDALNAQLEALGYVREEGARPPAKKNDNPYANVDLSHFLEGLDATFVFQDVQNGIEIIQNEARAKTRFSPCSTFKIPNTLIALDTGVATGPDMEIPWDSKTYPKEDWWDKALRPMGIVWDRNHTLKSAFKNSCVWYYRELAKRCGKERMQGYLDNLDYGNKDLSGGIDVFWLESSLKISAVEQIGFLKKLVQGRLPISEKTREAAFEVFEREKKAGRVLYAKTGGGKSIGWFVGIVADGDKRYLFAFNMAGTYEETAKRRIDLSIKMLQELGVWF